ncbi:hypothetical protein [Saccharopolyspora sp. NPDC050642]|uniref:hypothetical protein n=1 Tax=Saccharopolyspora sp. NPDC050642 TaxID=3157099 RepID=UPI0033E3C9D1
MVSLSPGMWSGYGGATGWEAGVEQVALCFFDPHKGVQQVREHVLPLLRARVQPEPGLIPARARELFRPAFSAMPRRRAARGDRWSPGPRRPTDRDPRGRGIPLRGLFGGPRASGGFARVRGLIGR